MTKYDQACLVVALDKALDFLDDLSQADFTDSAVAEKVAGIKVLADGLLTPELISESQTLLERETEIT